MILLTKNDVIKKHFLRFLKNNDVYIQYRNCFKQSKPHFRHLIKNNWFYNTKVDIINASFHWASTKEGHDFWMNLHKQWEKYVKQHKDIFY